MKLDFFWMDFNLCVINVHLKELNLLLDSNSSHGSSSDLADNWLLIYPLTICKYWLKISSAYVFAFLLEGHSFINSTFLNSCLLELLFKYTFQCIFRPV